MSDTPTQDWSQTLHLPTTEFPMRANLPTREPAWVADWLKKDENGQDLYTRLLAKRRAEGAPTYILHLGPPYANGNMHMGHALTYTLKDFIVRSKFMAGFASPYVPGWDCHGLPIEWKVEQNLRTEGKTKHSVSKAELRRRCRAYATHWSEVQKAEWQRFGALGDWDRPYRTMDAANEAGIVRELGKLVQRGLVEKSLRSTLWSWAEETAMAEAEVEYDEAHKSTAISVAMPIMGCHSEYLVIWTTTPWTIPANRAIAMKDDEDYVRVTHQGKQLWVAEKCLPALEKEWGTPLTPESVLKGRDMANWTYGHPLTGAVQPVLHGFHVTTDSGTGLVHIAPAHGAEDFTIGKEAGLDLRCPVDGAGKYEPWVEDNLPADSTLKGQLAGNLIWGCKEAILAELTRKGLLLKATDITHKYPISWRSKKPLIFRTTEQWFVALDKPIEALGGKSLREASLNRIYGRGVHGVQWVPGYGQNRIGSMIENRPDWCISRQRVWGVPITIFVEKSTGHIVTDPAVWEHIASLVAQENIDAWDTRIEEGRTAELFPAGWLASHGKTADDFTPVQDILDVWFDSGTTHAHVVRADSAEGQRFHRTDGKRPADMYQEGSDQHRGWFHSSLLTSVANYGDAPYESVVTSGFVVDAEGRKFSKSLGNGVEPRDLLPKYGMDIIRLWIASSDYSEDIRYSPQIIESASETYRRLRNTFRWLLGNLNGFDDTSCVDVTTLPELETAILARFGTVMEEVRTHYSAFQFHKGTRALVEFCGTELSNFYFDARKDVLYCDATTSPTRLACQTVLVHVFKGLATHLAPLMPFTTNEAWQSRYGEKACVHLETFAIPPAVTYSETRWNALMTERDVLNAEIEKLRAAGTMGANTEATVTSPSDLPAELLREACGVSAVASGTTRTAARHTGHKCPRCWRYYGALESSGVCLRCEDATTPAQKAA